MTMGLIEFIQQVRSLTPAQVEVVNATAAALQRDRYVIDTHGDGSELQEFDRYHQAVARVNAAAGAEYRNRLSELWQVWGAARDMADRATRTIVKNAGQALVFADIIPTDALYAVTAPIRAALGEQVDVPASTTPNARSEVRASASERAARAPEAR